MAANSIDQRSPSLSFSHTHTSLVLAANLRLQLVASAAAIMLQMPLALPSAIVVVIAAHVTVAALSPRAPRSHSLPLRRSPVCMLIDLLHLKFRLVIV